MARPIYSHEFLDPDFQWLVTSYTESNPRSVLIDQSCLPIVLLLLDEKALISRTEDSVRPETVTDCEDSKKGSDPVSDDT